jgi:hypothetical protein
MNERLKKVLKRIIPIKLVHFYFRIPHYFIGYPSNELMKFDIKNGILRADLYKGFLRRNLITMSMIMDAIDTDFYQKRKFSFWILTGDHIYLKKNNLFYYCIDDDSKLPWCIPDFAFHSWPEANITSYTEECAKIQYHSKKPPIHNKLFWAGNLSTHFTRQLFYNAFKDDTSRFEIHVVDTSKKDYMLNIVPMYEQLDYKYLIDLQGNGYSGRLKYLLHSGRLLFIQERKWKSYYHFKLKPFVHYIPVKEDFSDLYDQLNWAENNPIKVAEIIQHATDFALTELKYENVILELRNKLYAFANRN